MTIICVQFVSLLLFFTHRFVFSFNFPCLAVALNALICCRLAWSAWIIETHIKPNIIHCSYRTIIIIQHVIWCMLCGPGMRIKLQMLYLLHIYMIFSWSAFSFYFYLYWESVTSLQFPICYLWMRRELWIAKCLLNIENAIEGKWYVCV